jgi:short-subunit dehydrogenase
MSSPVPPSESAAPLALITGASSGIGRETATLLARRGCRTILIARRSDRIAALAAELSRHAPSSAVTLDLAEADTIEPVMNTLLAQHGPIEILINNAGGGICSPMLDQPLSAHHLMMQVHYFAAVAMIQRMLPSMLERKRGHVINVASISTKMGPCGHAAYAAAKCAVVSLTQTLAGDYAGRGVHFSYVNPGIVRTEFFDNPGYEGMIPQVKTHGIAPLRVARGIVKLLDHPRLELCVPRHYRALDAIKAISPRLAHWIVARNSRARIT